MKKQFLTVAVAALALAGCSKNETVEIASNRAIGFSNAFVNNGTRSIVDPSLTKTTLENFDVYGFVTNEKSESSQIFDGDDVTKGEGGKWGYTNTQYWVNGNTYTFGAIAPAGAATVSSEAITGTTNKKVGMTVAFTNTNDDQKDLLHAAPVAVAVSSDDYSTPVAMTFNHQLSKVKFSFKNAVGEGYSVKVTDVKITNAKSSGTLTVAGEREAANTWGSQNGTLELTFGHVVADNAESNTAVSIANTETKETYNEKLMIPTLSTTSYTVTFTTELFQGTTSVGKHAHSVTIKDVELKLGYCYDFTAELTYENVLDPEKPLKPIVFTVSETITDWNKTEEVQGLDVPATQLP